MSWREEKFRSKHGVGIGKIFFETFNLKAYLGDYKKRSSQNTDIEINKWSFGQKLPKIKFLKNFHFELQKIYNILFKFYSWIWLTLRLSSLIKVTFSWSQKGVTIRVSVTILWHIFLNKKKGVLGDIEKIQAIYIHKILPVSKTNHIFR